MVGAGTRRHLIVRGRGATWETFCASPRCHVGLLGRCRVTFKRGVGVGGIGCVEGGEKGVNALECSGVDSQACGPTRGGGGGAPLPIKFHPFK